MKRFLLILSGILLAITICILWGIDAMFTDKVRMLPDLPTPKNSGKFVPWECAFEADHTPPLPEEADALFMEARELQKNNKTFTAGEEDHIFTLYSKAAEQGHWKAMNNLINCYINGFGTERNLVEANRIADQMVAMGVPAGFYNKYVMFAKGYGIESNTKEASNMIHKAADFGYPLAQYNLGYHYIYGEHRDAQGMQYLICAIRQGHAGAAKEIADYLEIHDNYRMAVEYYYRSTMLGEYMAAFNLQEFFEGPEGFDGKIERSLGYLHDATLKKAFYGYYQYLKKNPGTRIPDLFKKHPIPENTLMTHEQSRAMPSPLKNAFGGKWPDEIFPELAPDYLPPKP